MFGMILPMFGMILPMFGMILPMFGMILPMLGMILPMLGMILPMLGIIFAYSSMFSNFVFFNVFISDTFYIIFTFSTLCICEVNYN